MKTVTTMLLASGNVPLARCLWPSPRPVPNPNAKAQGRQGAKSQPGKPHGIKMLHSIGLLLLALKRGPSIEAADLEVSALERKK